MFSATLPDWVAQISRRYLSDDKIRINLIKNSEQKTSMTVKHYAV
jgi:superfamily II DNA/RNA helicase